MPILTLILGILQAIVTTVPEIEGVIPIVQKDIAGQPITEADIAALNAVIATLNTQAAASA